MGLGGGDSFPWVCVCVCRCEPLDLFPDWLRPLHRLTMEMLAQEKCFYSGASH